MVLSKGKPTTWKVDLVESSVMKDLYGRNKYKRSHMLRERVFKIETQCGRPPISTLGFCIKAVPGPLKSMEVERYHQPQPVSSLGLMVRSNRFEGDYLSIIVNSDDVERTTSIN